MNLSAVLARRFAPVEQRYDWRDSALYALSLGFGDEPLNEAARRYVVEGPHQLVVPSFGVTLAWPPFWHREPELGIDWARALHGEQHFRLHRPLPLQTNVRATHRIVAIEDKGAGRGAVVHLHTELRSASSEVLLASLRSVQFLRGDGGCGSHGDTLSALPPLEADGAPSGVREFSTRMNAALFYRLASRDLITLHTDPEIARQAGLHRPPLHGLYTFGLACRTLLESHAIGTPERIRAMAARFVQPAYPGDTIRIELFETAEGLRYRARAVERDVLILDRGTCEIDA